MPQSKRLDEVSSASEFGKVLAFLAQKGVVQATIRAVLGNAANGRTRREIAETLMLWFFENAGGDTNVVHNMGAMKKRVKG